MESILFALITFPLAALFTGLGIYAMKRKKPMWFWSGSEVKPWQIRDIPAYNRANGWMWIGFSAGFWAAAVLSLFNSAAGGILLGCTCLIGIPLLVVTYQKIYHKYKI